MNKPAFKNSALSLMWAIGGVFQAIIQSKAEQADIEAFQRKDAKENPPEPRIAQPLRSYNKRYTHLMSGLQTRSNQIKMLKRKTAGNPLDTRLDDFLKA